jgi:hypothetical protein
MQAFVHYIYCRSVSHFAIYALGKVLVLFHPVHVQGVPIKQGLADFRFQVIVPRNFVMVLSIFGVIIFILCLSLFLKY